MNPLGFPLLADENIHPRVVEALRNRGKDVRTAKSERLTGAEDVRILRYAHRSGRVVLTHDSDFGVLSIRAREPYTGIIYLRPGHIDPLLVLSMLGAIESEVPEVEVPFLIVAQRIGSVIRIRVRSTG